MSQPGPTLRTRALSVAEFLFVLTLSLFFLVAGVMVIAQLLGTLLTQPSWVSAASDYLLIPSVSLASTFGLIAFVASYLRKDASEG